MLYKYPGKLIVFEGGEGAGKSTALKFLAAHLRQIGYKVVETKEPYGEYRKRLLDTHPMIAPSPEEELDLFIRNRAEHFKELIIPSLKAGKIILCDRSSFSTIAYQHYGRGLDLTDILVRDAKARKNVDFDLIVLLDIDPKIGLKRKDPETRFELEKIDFHHRVRRGYLEQAKMDFDKKWIVIDASQPEEIVKEQVREVILKFLYEENGREK
jgi:dTMP kinase